MRSKLFCMASLVVIVVVAAAQPNSSPRSYTLAATTDVPTTQCGYLDKLVSQNLATPAATGAATTSTPQATATIKLTNTPGSENTSGETSDEAPTTYRDTVQQFSIDYPHSWSQDTTFASGVCFTGRDSSIAVQFIKGIASTDLIAYVKADEASVQAIIPGYKQVYLKASTEVKGAVILGYEWDAGKSTVTEKPIHARTDRYYLIDSLGRLVIISETEPINQFDPDGVRDTALTYQVVR